MLTGEIKNKVSQIWNTVWSGGISNPLTAIEQLTYLLFIKRLDEIHTAREARARRLKKPLEDPIFTAEQEPFRWSRIKLLSPAKMGELFTRPKGVFNFIKTLHRDGESGYARFMKDAVFLLTNNKTLDEVIGLLDEIPMHDRDTKGDLYEFLLSKLSTAGQNGQFRTPRHIIKMMVQLMAPGPDEKICDPAAGTGGFLMAAGEYVRENHKTLLNGTKGKNFFNSEMFTAYDFDISMCRIGAMNLFLHGIEKPVIENLSTLDETFTEAEKYSLILANPPFKGSLDANSVSKSLTSVVSTKKTELLFLSLFIRLLETGGRCACIVPDGVLFGSSAAHKAIRKELVENQRLEGIISMPSGVFKPYAGVSTGILIFTRTDEGGTENVWFYDMKADGFTLDDKRTELDDKHENNNIPDIIKRWHDRDKEAKRKRTDQSFNVPVQEIRDNGYDLSINRYKEMVYEEVHYDAPEKIMEELAKIDEETAGEMEALRGMLGE